MRQTFLFLWVLSLAACARAEAPSPVCVPYTHDETPYIVCETPAHSEGLRLFHTGPDGEVFGQFDTLTAHLSSQGQTLTFAMNAGMYHQDRAPVGLYVEAGEETAPLVTRAGPGNFGMLPNGVFWIDEDGTSHVTETLAFAALDTSPRYASQSGPMLVIEGDLHPKFNADSTSRKRRNGVGRSADGETLYFVISEVPVNFHSFARLFRDGLDCPNALYLDGTVSKLYAPELERNERGLDMGPVVALVSGPESE